jgi:Superfamily I DNA and RNA helicases
MVAAVGLPEHYKKERDGRGVERIENLEQLGEATRRFAAEAGDYKGDLLGSFLAHAALEAGDAHPDDAHDALQLMTLRSAKGLEFPVVFVTGVEEGLFPHNMSADHPARLEEERLLCYMGMTRAMQRLYLTHAESRRLHGRKEYPLPSSFLPEVPAESGGRKCAAVAVTWPVTYIGRGQRRRSSASVSTWCTRSSARVWC